jgi:hypothetical protein
LKVNFITHRTKLAGFKVEREAMEALSPLVIYLGTLVAVSTMNIAVWEHPGLDLVTAPLALVIREVIPSINMVTETIVT